MAFQLSALIECDGTVIGRGEVFSCRWIMEDRVGIAGRGKIAHADVAQWQSSDRCRAVSWQKKSSRIPSPARGMPRLELNIYEFAWNRISLL
jgi:hypothetical protein